MTLSAAFYFIFFAAIACLVPYLALFYQSLGMTGSQIGLLTGIYPLISLVGAPLWTGLADATHRHKAVMAAAIVSAVTLAAIIPGVTSILWLVLIIALFALLSSPINSLADSATMAMLGERKDRYGQVRLWGTLGWALVAPLAGELVERLGLDFSFWAYAALMAVGLLVALRMPFHLIHAGTQFSQGMRTLLANRKWMVFLLIVFVCGIGMASINNYLFVYMESLGFSKTLMGLSLTVSTLSEIPVMYFAGRLLRRYSLRWLLAAAMLVIALRLVLYSFTGVGWVILLIQLTHGMTFPLVWVLGVAYADQTAQPGMKATAQGMFGGVMMGFGAAAGGLVGGILLEMVGPALMYRYVGLLVLASLAGFAALEKQVTKSSAESFISSE